MSSFDPSLTWVDHTKKGEIVGTPRLFWCDQQVKLGPALFLTLCLSVQELRNTGSRAEDATSEKDGSPRDEVLRKSTPADEKEARGGSEGRKPERKIARRARDAASEKVDDRGTKTADEYAGRREGNTRQFRGTRSRREARLRRPEVGFE